MKRPTYTSASFIKKVFRPGERSLPRNEFLERLDQTLSDRNIVIEAEAMLQEVLTHPASPVRVGRSDAILELTYAPHQVFDLAYRFMRDTHVPRILDQIIPELRKRTSFSWNQISRMLELERDPRFVQYEGDKRWNLAEWKVANDHLFTFARERKFQQMALRSIGHVLEMYLGENAKEYVFLPELDERFQVDGEVVYIRDQEVEVPGDKQSIASLEEIDEVAASFDEEAVETTFETEAAETQSEEKPVAKEEYKMNTTLTKPVLQEVDQLLKQAVALLESRNHEMGQEVVSNFQQSNMQAIEELMQEKWKNEQLVQGIQQVVATIGQ